MMRFYQQGNPDKDQLIQDVQKMRLAFIGGTEKEPNKAIRAEYGIEPPKPASISAYTYCAFLILGYDENLSDGVTNYITTRCVNDFSFQPLGVEGILGAYKDTAKNDLEAHYNDLLSKKDLSFNTAKALLYDAIRTSLADNNGSLSAAAEQRIKDFFIAKKAIVNDVEYANVKSLAMLNYQIEVGIEKASPQQIGAWQEQVNQLSSTAPQHN